MLSIGSLASIIYIFQTLTLPPKLSNGMLKDWISQTPYTWLIVRNASVCIPSIPNFLRKLKGSLNVLF